MLGNKGYKLRKEMPFMGNWRDIDTKATKPNKANLPLLETPECPPGRAGLQGASIIFLGLRMTWAGLVEMILEAVFEVVST